MKRSSLFLILTLLSLILLACQAKNQAVEITETDLFSLPKYHSLNVTVLNIRLGDSEERVLTALGKPDTINSYSDQGVAITNFEYKTLLETEKIGLVVHLENGIVERITFKEPFNKYLKGKTKITPEYRKEELFNLLGKPTRKSILKPFEIYSYEDRGLEVLYNEKGWNGFTLVRPKEVQLVNVLSLTAPQDLKSQ